MSRGNLQRLGESVFLQSDRVSAELLALTYGSTVRQLLADFEGPEEVNKQLDKMGYNIGIRIADDFVAKTKIKLMSKVAFKMYLGVAANLRDWNDDRTAYSVQFDENPLTEFTELPERCGSLWYANIICGVVRGAYEMIQMAVECTYQKCVLRGDDTNEVRVVLKEIIEDRPPIDED